MYVSQTKEEKSLSFRFTEICGAVWEFAYKICSTFSFQRHNLPKPLTMATEVLHGLGGFPLDSCTMRILVSKLFVTRGTFTSPLVNSLSKLLNPVTEFILFPSFHGEPPPQQKVQPNQTRSTTTVITPLIQDDFAVNEILTSGEMEWVTCLDMTLADHV